MKRRDFIQTSTGIVLLGPSLGWAWLRRLHSPTAEFEAQAQVRRQLARGNYRGPYVRSVHVVHPTDKYLLRTRLPSPYGPAVNNG